MRLAIIDLGTNSVRFDVHLLRERRRTQLIHREKVMVRLGDGVFSTGQLNDAAKERTIETFRAFKRTADELKVDRIVAVGTSALRDAKDGQAFAETVKRQTGIELRIISGVEEAQLISLGVLQNDEAPRGYYALVDIGGGSTEISLCQGKRVINSLSLPLGTARLTQLFLKSTPPRRERSDAPNPIEQLRAYIRKTTAAEPLCKIWPTTKLIIGSSGTIRSLVRLKKGLGKRGMRSISRETLRKLVRQMSRMSTEELLAMPGMSAKRVDMILGGGILLEEVMDFLGARKVTLTDFSLRDGLIESELQAAQSKGRSNRKLDDSVPAARVSHQPPPIAQQIECCREIFRAFQPAHKLKSKWLRLAIATLHAERLHLDHLESSRHGLNRNFTRLASRMIVPRQLEALKPWERKFVMYLLDGKKRGTDCVPKEFARDEERKWAFLVIGSMLRLADSATLTARADSLPLARSLHLATAPAGRRRAAM